MKAQAKAIVASIVVIALALTAVSGVTYSWFSDTENSDIDISTAKIDIKGEFTESSVTGAGADGDNHTVATPTGNNLKIENLIAATQVSSTYSVTNESRVSTIYRMYVSIDSDNLPTSMSIKVTASNSVLTVSEQPLTFTDGIAYIVGGKESGKPLEVGTEPLKFTINIITKESFSTSFNSTIKVICEAYQSDYKYTEPQVINSSGEAKMPQTATSDVMFKGTAPVSETGAQASDIEMIFSAGAINAAMANAQGEVTLNAEMLAPAGDVAKIKLSLTGTGVSTSFGEGNYVTVSINVPGQHDGVEVVYVGDSSNPPILLGCSYDNSTMTTKITFKTNHFSEFRIISLNNYTVKDSEELSAVIADMTTTNKIIELLNGNYVTNLCIPANHSVTLVGESVGGVTLSGQLAALSPSVLKISNMTYYVDEKIKDATNISQTSSTAIALWGDAEFYAEDVTFNMSLSGSTAITTWWSTGDGANVTVRNCIFDCNGQRPIRSDSSVTVEGCTFNDPYRYAVQVTSKASTITSIDKATVNFNDNIINAGSTSSVAFVYGVQLEGETYGCSNLVINGSVNIINNLDETGKTGQLYYCECGKVDHNTIVWNTEVVPVHESP